MPTPEEMLDQAAIAGDTAYNSRWPGMSYEQGVEAALLWAAGESSESPMNGDD